MAWTSPIWVDYVPVKLARPSNKKPIKSTTEISFEEDEEEEVDDDFDYEFEE